MNPQEFLSDRLEQVKRGLGFAVTAAPFPTPAKMVLNIGGSTPIKEDEYNPGPLFKIGNVFAGEQFITPRPEGGFNQTKLSDYEARVQ